MKCGNFPRAASTPLPPDGDAVGPLPKQIQETNMAIKIDRKIVKYSVQKPDEKDG